MSEQPTEQTYATDVTEWINQIIIEGGLPFSKARVEIIKDKKRAFVLLYDKRDNCILIIEVKRPHDSPTDTELMKQTYSYAKDRKGLRHFAINNINWLVIYDVLTVLQVENQIPIYHQFENQIPITHIRELVEYVDKKDTIKESFREFLKWYIKFLEERTIPKLILSEYINLGGTGMVALNQDRYKDAETAYRKQIQLIMENQPQVQHTIKKGEAYYHLGLSILKQSRIEEAIHSFLLAYIEYTLNVDFDKEDNAEYSDAAHKLRDEFQINPQILREIRMISAQKKLEGKLNKQTDPEFILIEALTKLGVDRTNLTSQCVKIWERQPLGFPQPWDLMVFIGANYDTFWHIVPEIKEAVIQLGYTPVVAKDYDIPQTEIHHHSLMLLHTCKYAIIELTDPAGQYMEIERLRDYEITTLLIRSARQGDIGLPTWLSGMIETAGYAIELYKDVYHLKEIIRSFLKLTFPGKNIELKKSVCSEIEPEFDAEIIPQTVKRGQSITTSIHYKGELVNGFFYNEIHFPDNIRKGSNWDLGTLPNEDPEMQGNLNGYVDIKSKWEWRIPKWVPLGKYNIIIRAYNHFGLNNRLVVREKEIILKVI